MVGIALSNLERTSPYPIAYRGELINLFSSHKTQLLHLGFRLLNRSEEPLLRTKGMTLRGLHWLYLHFQRFQYLVPF